MSQSITISGAAVKIFINNKLFTSAQSVQFSINYNESGIFGIDTALAQEIAPGKIEITGSISGLRTTMSGGIQAISGRPLLKDHAASPYISLRIQDRASSEDIIFIPSCKIRSESHSIQAKGKYLISFEFEGIIPLQPLDRVSI